MFSLFLPPKIASAVRKYGDVTIFDASASFLSLAFAGMLKSSGPKKRIRAIIGLLFSTNTRRVDEILSDFSEEMIIRLFYRRKSPLPYNCTAEAGFDDSASFLSLPDRRDSPKSSDRVRKSDFVKL